jgi:hypothetical protein
MHELKKDLPDFLTRAGEGIKLKEVMERLKKHLSEGGDLDEFIIKLSHTPEEYQEIAKELRGES